MERGKIKYPGVIEAEQERLRVELLHKAELPKPDFIGNAPNYEKFKGWDVEKVLVWLNVD